LQVLSAWPPRRDSAVFSEIQPHLAVLARATGAEVVERTDNERRGKGYALDFGVRHLRTDPPEVVIIIDADCLIAPGAIARLALECAASGRPVQALYLMHAPADSGLRLRIAEFAWRLKNQVRPLGFRCLGLPCQLMGTGMAFPWKLLAAAPLASGELVEDLKLGIDLSLQGFPPLFCPDAEVSSWFPTEHTAGQSQRTRWEHGHLRLLAQECPRLLLRALKGHDGPLFALALDLAVPPLSLFLLLLVVSLLLFLVATFFGLGHWAFWISLANLGLFALAILLAWHGWARDLLTPADLLSVPGYILRKIPIYLQFLTRRQTKWVKTGRDG
jgi:cellulose synthase/poly-beta-1,6-N-acetylglucosamine synthase-like glycosyltransferase